MAVSGLRGRAGPRAIDSILISCHTLPKLSRDNTWVETTLRSMTDLSTPAPAASVFSFASAQRRSPQSPRASASPPSASFCPLLFWRHPSVTLRTSALWLSLWSCCPDLSPFPPLPSPYASASWLFSRLWYHRPRKGLPAPVAYWFLCIRLLALAELFLLSLLFSSSWPSCLPMFRDPQPQIGSSIGYHLHLFHFFCVPQEILSPWRPHGSFHLVVVVRLSRHVLRERHVSSSSSPLSVPFHSACVSTQPRISRHSLTCI